ncbi:hypothetical protein BS50DRAFT_548732 [Corynespora cassiicola Philippines]|uniref:Uncharacterized protein n=1 Tax=Corynespora cassiicola Philippines TaxID=1448308 RepID=A0A2T2NYX0_CORCC|nr:hypothetical protein BS50DRAFT_548732 [Corynespora cassiicola Philippines]
MDTRLWYKEPAELWTDALPIGNGRIGAMIFGDPLEERMQVNEESVYSGNLRDRVNQDSQATVLEVRQLLAQGEIGKAEQLASLGMTGTPETCRHYETLGEMELYFDGTENYDEDSYERWLDLGSALAGVRFKVGETQYEREMFASAPDDIIVHRLTVEGDQKLSFQVRVHRPFGGGNSASERDFNENGMAYMVGATSGFDPIGFAAGLAVESDGNVRTLGQFLVVENATEAVVYFAATTTYRHEDTLGAVDDTIQKAMQYSYDDLLQRHIDDYTPLFNASTLQLDSPDLEAAELPTNERLNATQKGADDPGLVSLQFNYGRYMLIASSREGTLPANLQGIWCEDFESAWGSKYTTNINLQMNYWPAEVTNIGSIHSPLFDLIELMRRDGTNTARKMYNASGWMAHHNTDLWGDTAPEDRYLPATYWTLSSGWLVTHILEHYWYTSDEDFLISKLGTLSEAIQFYLDTLQPYTFNGTEYLVTTPSVSPENTYELEDGESYRFAIAPTCDVQILNELFTGFLRAVSSIGNASVEPTFLDEIKRTQDKLPPYRISKRYPGLLQEWMEDYVQAQPDHRHVSHLYALYPGTQIPPPGAPGHNEELWNAAGATLEYRLSHGGAGTGWSRAWTINWYARLLNGTALAENIYQFFNSSVYPNLFDAHPPFQADGNWGFTSGVAEALIQSHVIDDKGTREVVLFPALPGQWQSGKVTGLVARGGFVFDLEWDNGNLSHMRLHSRLGGPVVIRYDGAFPTDQERVNLTMSKDSPNVTGTSHGYIKVDTEPGDFQNFHFVW